MKAVDSLITTHGLRAGEADITGPIELAGGQLWLSGEAGRANHVLPTTHHTDNIAPNPPNILSFLPPVVTLTIPSGST